MAGQSRRWMILVATVWIQAFTGTNFDFSAYSSDLKSVMGISQVQLNYLATASDLGKALGWSSGLALLYLPLPVVLLLAAFLGLLGYGFQWLLITSRISLPYFPVFLMCLLAGCSICWFNTVCFVLCIRNFPVSRSLALSLTISFNGVSAALYTLIANATATTGSVYLLLNATVPLLVSAAALLPILRQPSFIPSDDPTRPHDTHLFLLLNALAFLTGIYLLALESISSVTSTARLLLAGALAMLLLPLCAPGVVCARDWARRAIYSRFEDPELHKELVGNVNGGDGGGVVTEEEERGESWWWCWCCDEVLEKDRVVVLGEEHGARRVVKRVDFWMYYVAYFCGATVGLVYSNNLGQIAQSLGKESKTTTLVTVYSACSFFGRLLSAAPDFLRGKVSFARTGWMAIATVPMPIAFFLLAEAGDGNTLVAGTALVGLSSGFITSAAVSVTSELFGPNSVGLNHNILITNIPLGSLLYGSLAALVYDAHGTTSFMAGAITDGAIVCMGRQCYADTFVWWGFISLVGLACSVALYLRTKSAYRLFYRSMF